MNKIINVLVLMFGIFVVVSCGKDEIKYQAEFEKSYAAWLKFKAASGNSYCYEVKTSSWVGYSSTTSIAVTNGKVTKRSFKAEFKKYDGTELQTPDDFEATEWTENESEINTHENAAAPLTLDEIYHKAGREWLIKRDNAKAYFETKNNGLISLCGYVTQDCADDCFIGISISDIKNTANH